MPKETKEGSRMAYWWVSQNQTYRHERDGGFLWAPIQNEDGNTFFHWDTMNLVQPGDVIFSYVGGQIVSISIAKAAAYESPRPGGMGEGLWEREGKRIDVDYRDVPKSVAISKVVNDLQPLLPGRYSPLNRYGTGNQGYLFALPPQAGRFLLDRCGEEYDLESDILTQGVLSSVPDRTERTALILSRVGQGVFRERLMEVWGRRCAVTGLNLPQLLRASHAL